MIPYRLSQITNIVVFSVGGVVCILGLALLCLVLGWRIMGRIGRYKDLHAYIKEHKVEFFEWGRRRNKKKHIASIHDK